MTSLIRNYIITMHDVFNVWTLYYNVGEHIDNV